MYTFIMDERCTCITHWCGEKLLNSECIRHGSILQVMEEDCRRTCTEVCQGNKWTRGSYRKHVPNCRLTQHRHREESIKNRSSVPTDSFNSVSKWKVEGTKEKLAYEDWSKKTGSKDLLKYEKSSDPLYNLYK
jgi:hypothetical protein